MNTFKNVTLVLPQDCYRVSFKLHKCYSISLQCFHASSHQNQDQFFNVSHKFHQCFPTSSHQRQANLLMVFTSSTSSSTIMRIKNKTCALQGGYSKIMKTITDPTVTMPKDKVPKEICFDIQYKYNVITAVIPNPGALKCRLWRNI